MSEICPDCLGKILGEDISPYRYIISRELDLCEECGKLSHVVVCERKWSRSLSMLKDMAEAIKTYKSRKNR